MQDFIVLISLVVLIGISSVVFFGGVRLAFHHRDVSVDKEKGNTSMVAYMRDILLIVGGLTGVCLILFTAVSLLWVMVYNILEWFF